MRRRYSREIARELFRPLERGSAKLLQDQLADRLERVVQSGLLQPNEYLPPMRLLAAKLALNLGTVARAYRRLEASRMVFADSTRGLRVITVPRQPSSGPVPELRPSLLSAEVPPNPLSTKVVKPQGAGIIRFDLAEPGAFPLRDAIVGRAFSAVLKDAESFGYAPLAGAEGTHRAIETYLARRRIALEGTSLLVTSGTTQSLAIVTRALAPEGALVAAENPTWHVALSIFAAARVRVVALPTDEEGIRVDALADILRRQVPAFLYLQPNFQNPTGVTLSLARRRSLLGLAREYGLPLVEDDFASDLAFDTPAPALQAGESVNHVIHLRSFAKVLIPTLRVGVIVAPARFSEPLQDARHGLDPFVSQISQGVLARCLDDDDFPAHVAEIRGALKRRWETLKAALQQGLPAPERLTEPRGGMCAWLELAGRFDMAPFLADLALRGLAVAPGPLFSLGDANRRALRLCFGAVTEDQIERGVKLLASVFEKHARKRVVAVAVTEATAP